MSLSRLNQYKQEKKPFAGLSLFDASFASVAKLADIDFILVGDSLGSCVQGHDSTVPVTLDDMRYHISAVQRANPSCLLIGDMPFMSYTTPAAAQASAHLLMQAGAHMVKMEGSGLKEHIEALNVAGVPVAAHLGLTPQHVHRLGGYKVQGRTLEEQTALRNDAKELESAGAQLLFLECVPSALAADISAELSIPVIGIGAGSGTDGQILVAYDVIGLTPRTPKFVKNFLAETTSIEDAFRQYVQETQDRVFPGPEHTYDK